MAKQLNLAVIMEVYRNIKQENPKVTKNIRREFRKLKKEGFTDFERKLYSLYMNIVKEESITIDKYKDKLPIYLPSNSKSKQACFKKMKELKTLGEGAYGKVYLVSNKKYKYAIKVQQLRGDDDEQDQLRREYEISKKMGELGIGPKIYDNYICKDPQTGKLSSYIIMEYMRGGNIMDWLDNQEEVTPKMIQQLTNQLRSKLKKVHKAKFVHKDLHEGNIFIQIHKNGQPELMIGDFGLAASFKDIIKVRTDIDKGYIQEIIDYTLLGTRDSSKEFNMDAYICRKMVKQPKLLSIKRK